MAFIDLIFFAAIALFLGYRLWSILGTHDAERPLKKERKDEFISAVRSHVNPKPHVSPSNPTSSYEEKKDTGFLRGAKLAFQKIVEAYAEENLSVLRKLVRGPLLETFEEAIEKRKAGKKTLEVDFGRITEAEILDKWEEKGSAYVTVRFTSHQSLVTKNASGKVLEGDPDRYSEVTDIWTFSRPLKSSDPNWTLIATQVPEVESSSASPRDKE